MTALGALVLTSLIANNAAIGAAQPGGSNILRRVPSDATAVVVIRDFNASKRRVGELANQMGLPLPVHMVDLDQTIGDLVDSEAWNHDEPIVLILTEPAMEPRNIVIGFTLKEVGDNQQRWQRGKLPPVGRDGAARYGARIGRHVFVSPNEPSLNKVMDASPRDSLAARMSEDQRRMFDRSDAWIHVNVQAWLPRVRAAIDPFTGLIKAIGAMQTGNSDVMSAMFDWSLQHFQGVLDEMSDFDLALRLEADGLTLSHLHVFEKGKSVSKYLASSTQHGGDMWAGLPDRPFLMAFASDWHAAGDAEIYLSLQAKLCECPSMAGKLTAESRKETERLIVQWYGMMHGTNGYVAISPGDTPTMEWYASYRVPDSAKAMDSFLAMQRHGKEMMDAMMMGMGVSGEYTLSNVDNRPVYRWKYETDSTKGQMAAMTAQVYGSNVTFAISPVSEDRIGYAVSAREAPISEMIRAVDQRNIGRNPNLRRVISHLPEKPHVVMVLNLGEAMSYSSIVGGLTAPVDGRRRGRNWDKDPLIGWALTVQPESVRGDLYLSAEDAKRLVTTVMMMQMQANMQHAPAGKQAPTAEPELAPVPN